MNRTSRSYSLAGFPLERWSFPCVSLPTLGSDCLPHGWLEELDLLKRACSGLSLPLLARRVLHTPIHSWGHWLTHEGLDPVGVGVGVGWG